MLLNCVVYRLTTVFLIQAMDLFFWGAFIRLQMFFKMGVLKIFENFTRKYLHWSLFKVKLQAFRPSTLLKRDSDTGVFVWNFPNFHNIFFTEHLRWLLLGTGTHDNTIFFERSAFLWGSRDHTWRGLFSWFHSIWKTEVSKFLL